MLSAARDGETEEVREEEVHRRDQGAALRTFDALERSVAERVMTFRRRRLGVCEAKMGGASENCEVRTDADGNGLDDKSSQDGGSSSSSLRTTIIRGVVIGGTGLVAGSLFAVLGGFVAPAIAAGVSTITGATIAATTTVTTLTASSTVTILFGLGGGGIAAYKMTRRTVGLTEFTLNSHAIREDDNELLTVVGISGWLRDKGDFIRPWIGDIEDDEESRDKKVTKVFLSLNEEQEDILDKLFVYLKCDVPTDNDDCGESSKQESNSIPQSHQDEVIINSHDTGNDNPKIKKTACADADVVPTNTDEKSNDNSKALITTKTTYKLSLPLIQKKLPSPSV